VDKCLDSIKLHLPDGLKRDLQDLALADDRAVSEYIRHVLFAHVYGAKRSDKEGANSGDEVRR
jgi:hypothetical protein